MADEEEDIEEEVVQGPPPSKLVFVNNVDSYTGSAIAKVLKLISFCFATCTIANVRSSSVHWLKITERIECKLLSLTYKVFTTTQGPYLHKGMSVKPCRIPVDP